MGAKQNIKSNKAQSYAGEIILPAHALRSARKFQAVNDVRYYLGGICLKKDGRIVATNGRTMFVYQGESLAEKLADDLIIHINGAIPKRADTAIVSQPFGPEGQRKCQVEFRVEESSRSKLPYTVLGAEVIDAEFPDIDKVIPGSKPVPCSHIGINPDYVSLASDVCRHLGQSHSGCKFEFYGEMKPIVVSFLADDKARVYIMQMRIS